MGSRLSEVGLEEADLVEVTLDNLNDQLDKAGRRVMKLATTKLGVNIGIWLAKIYSGNGRIFLDED